MYSLGWTDDTMKVTIKTTKKKVKELSNGQMVDAIKEVGKTVSNMEKESMSQQMEKKKKANGKRVNE